MDWMSIFWNNTKGFYYLSYRDKQGIRRQVSTRESSKSKALHFLRQYSERERARHTITLSNYATEFKLFSKSVHRPKTQLIFRLAFEEFQRVINDIQLKLVGVREIDRFLAHKINERSIWTARKYYGALAFAFQKAVEWNYLEENPFRRVKKPKPEEQDAPFVSPIQFRSIAEMIRNASARDVAAIAFNTGMRLNEILSLEWSSIDLTSGVIKVRNTPTFKTKSGKQRSIPMNTEVFSIFLRWEKQQRVEDDRVFPGLKDDFVSKQFKMAAKIILGDKTKIHFHSLRHSFCSNLMRAGANVRVVQALAGHSDITTTEKYLHCVPADARNAVNLLSMN